MLEGEHHYNYRGRRKHRQPYVGHNPKPSAADLPARVPGDLTTCIATHGGDDTHSNLEQDQVTSFMSASVP